MNPIHTFPSDLGPHYPPSSNLPSRVPPPLVSNPPTSGFFEGTTLPPPNLGGEPQSSTRFGTPSNHTANPPSGKSTRPAKKYKGVKARSKRISLTFGENLQMGDVLDTTDRVLVGWVRGRSYMTARLLQWI